MHGIKKRMLRRQGCLALTASILGVLAMTGTASAATGSLTLTNTAPSTVTVGSAFQYTIKLTNTAPTASTATSVVDQLPANTTLLGFNHTQGTCSSTGTPAKVTCDLGTLASNASATVTLAVEVSKAGTVTDTATAGNAAGDSATAPATTTVTPAPPAGTAPQAQTGASQPITNSRAQLLGTIIPGNQPTGYFFELGTSKSYGTITPVRHTGTTQTPVSATVSGLQAATTYHYRLVAINDSGTSYGADRTFTTTGSRYLGSLVLDSTRLQVKNHNVYVPFTCQSTQACVFRFTIVIRARVAQTGKLATVVFTKNQNGLHTIGAHKALVEAVGVQPGALAILEKAKGHRMTGKLTTRPRTNQAGLIRQVTLIG